MYLDLVKLQLELSPLLKQKIHISELKIEQVDIHLEELEIGEVNWVLNIDEEKQLARQGRSCRIVDKWQALPGRT